MDLHASDFGAVGTSEFPNSASGTCQVLQNAVVAIVGPAPSHSGLQPSLVTPAKTCPRPEEGRLVGGLVFFES